MTNDDLFVKVLARIVADPSSHDQSGFAGKTECGTTYCMAGHTVIECGYKLQWRNGLFGVDAIKVSDGRFIDDVAAGLLGIKGLDVLDLFYNAQSVGQVFEVSARLMGIDEQVLRDKVAAEVAS